MHIEPIPPPTYSRRDPEDGFQSANSSTAQGPQLLITPTTDAINFQKGYLGAEGERAAIEGEIQIKGAQEGQYARVTASLKTIEVAYDREIELAFREVVLYPSAAGQASSDTTTTSLIPSSLPFSIPLTPDTPQSIRTPQSSLTHVLTATLHPKYSSSLISKSIEVHTKRYSSHTHTLATTPELHSLSEPTHIRVEIPRNAFNAGESVPVYLTVPPPRRELVVDQGLRLRNVRVELVKVVKVKREAGEEDGSDTDADPPSDGEVYFEPERISAVFDGSSRLPPLSTSEAQASTSLAKAPLSPLFLGSSFRTVLARSGALCRFHSSKPIKLRFLLHQPPSSNSPNSFRTNLPDGDHGQNQTDSDCASVTQSTVFHTISFRLNISISFVDMSSRTERFSNFTIPITFLPPPAPLPEVAGSVDVAYQKKHDQPPSRTYRYDDEGTNIPRYDTFGGAGPSGAPPPFEERDAPPSFFASTSTLARLPTFLESETEIIMPTTGNGFEVPLANTRDVVPGEGVDFGFPVSEQFDGHTEEMEGSVTPPPTLEMAMDDPDVTTLAENLQPEHAIEALEALELALDQHEEANGISDLSLRPPPPPAMDDPSDPPPSIDSDFRSPTDSRPTPPPHQSSPLSYDGSLMAPVVDDPSDPPPSIDSAFRSPTQSGQQLPTPSSPPQIHSTDVPMLAAPQPPRSIQQATQEHAPPPYLIPETGELENINIIRPPPYIDVLHHEPPS